MKIVRKLFLLLVVLLSPSVVSAQSLPVQITIEGNTAVARVGAPGTPIAEVILDFEDASGLTASSLGLTASLVKVMDPTLLARLPSNGLAQIPTTQPLLITIEPPATGGLSFRGTGRFELHTHALPYEIGSSLRVFKAPLNGTFRDTTEEIAQGSVRARSRYDGFSQFIIAADECYSEIYFDETTPPLGALEAAHRLGRSGFPRLLVFSSLSKRSNVPGMRSGFVAGDAAILEKFLLYRTYHGSAMNPAVQSASEAAWNDELHVIENRRLYREKFAAVTESLAGALQVSMPDAAFYLWIKTPVSDIEFTRQLYRDYNVTVLPGSYLARYAHGINPGENFIRAALVAPLTECVEAAGRIKMLTSSLQHAGKSELARISH